MKYQFDDYIVDSVAFHIVRAGQRVDAQLQVIEILLLVLENRDRIVGREEVFSTVWKGRLIFTADIGVIHGNSLRLGAASC